MKNQRNKVYAAGIADRNDDWVWQGTVVAKSQSAAKKLLAEFKKQRDLNGRCEVVTFGETSYTERSEGVSESTNLF